MTDEEIKEELKKHAKIQRIPLRGRLKIKLHRLFNKRGLEPQYIRDPYDVWKRSELKPRERPAIPFKIKKKLRVGFFFTGYVIWVGAFWDQKKDKLYVCPLPCCVFTFERK